MAEALLSTIEDLVRDLREDYIESQRDRLIRIRREVFRSYYMVRRITSPNPASIGFVDAGFKRYKLDVSLIIPIHVGGILKDPEGGIHTLNKLLGEPPTDLILLYASRRREGDLYRFKFRVKPLQKKTFLFGNTGEAEEASRRLYSVLEEAGLTTTRQRPRLFIKLAQYIEGLLELAYAIKLLHALKTRGYSVDYIVLDGTLVKWFSIKRTERGKGIDGLDILAAILGVKPGDVRGLLWSIIGLSKTTSFTRLVRSHELFQSSPGEPKPQNSDLYTIINREGVKHASEVLGELLVKAPAKGFVEETIRILNRPVYFYHSVYVSRFPVTMDGMNVFTIDMYLDRPVIDVEEGRVVYAPTEWIDCVNHRITRTAETLFSQRTRVYAEPPRGFMEIDDLVRFRPELQSLFENALLATLGRVDDLTARILRQAFTSTIQMRYGYG